MRNRAKCKLCHDILESFHRHDFVTCKCGEISVDGGLDYYKCSAKNWGNFLRVDDEGNEIVIKVESEEKEAVKDSSYKPNKKELMEMLDAMIKNIENLPQNAMHLPISHYDLLSFMLLVSSCFKAED